MGLFAPIVRHLDMVGKLVGVGDPRVTICDAGGNCLGSISPEKNWTVRNVKEAIERELTGLELYKQRLLVGINELRDDDPLPKGPLNTAGKLELTLLEIVKEEAPLTKISISDESGKCLCNINIVEKWCVLDLKKALCARLARRELLSQRLSVDGKQLKDNDDLSAQPVTADGSIAIRLSKGTKGTCEVTCGSEADAANTGRLSKGTKGNGEVTGGSEADAANTQCEWMFGDCATGILGFNELSPLNPFRWSGAISLEQGIKDLQGVLKRGSRPILVKAPPGISTTAEHFETPREAIEYFKKLLRARLEAKVAAQVAASVEPTTAGVPTQCSSHASR